MTDAVNQEIESLKAQVKGLGNSLTAHQGMLNDSLQGCIQLRTQMVTFQQAWQEATQELKKTKADYEALLKKHTELDAELSALKEKQAA